MTAEQPAWAVSSVWRGDRAKLGRIAAAMEDATGGRAAGRTRIEVLVLDDVERYRSFSQFRLEAPEQTTKEFERLELIRGPLTVSIRRKETDEHQRGVTLHRDGEASSAGVVTAIRRGGIQWVWAQDVPKFTKLVNAKPSTNRTEGARATSEAELERRNGDRKKLMWVWTSWWVFFAGALLYGALRPVSKASAGELLAVTAGLVVVAVGAGAIRLIRDFALPPVEIADNTPGRRLLGRLIAVGGPVAAAVVKAVT